MASQSSSEEQPPQSSWRCLPLSWKKKQNEQESAVNDLPVPEVFLPVEDDGKLDSAMEGDLFNVAENFKKQKKKEKVDDKVKSVRKRNNAFLRLWVDIGKAGSPDSQSDSHDGVESCKNALVPCLNAIKTLGKDRKQFINVLFLTQIAVKMVISLYLAAIQESDEKKIVKFDDEARGNLLTIMKQIRSTLKPPLQNADLPVTSLNFSLSRLEIGIKAIPDADFKKKLMKDGAKFIFGAAMSVAQMKLNSGVTEGLAGLAKLGVEKVIQKQAKSVFSSVVKFEYHAALVQSEMFGGGLPQGEKLSNMKTKLKALEDHAVKESRWEVLASFVDVLASAVLGDGTGKEGKTIHAVNANFLQWVVEGDESFLGLQGLSSFGEDPPIKDALESGSDVPLFAFDRWASNLFEGVLRAGLEGKSIQDGVSLAQSQIEIGLQSFQDEALRFLDRVSDLVENQLALAAQQPFRIANDKLEKLLEPKPQDPQPQNQQSQNQQQDTGDQVLDEILKKLNSAKLGLDKASKTVDSIKSIFPKLIAVLTKAHQVAEQGYKFLSKLNSIFGGIDIKAAFQKELEGDLKNVQSSFIANLSELQKTSHDNAFQEHQDPFTDAAEVDKYAESISLSRVSDTIDSVMRAMSAYTAVHAMMKLVLEDTSQAEENKFGNALKKVSEFRMLAQTQKVLIETSKESLRQINKEVDRTDKTRRQKELRDSFFKHAKNNFESSKTKFTEIRDTIRELFKEIIQTSGAEPHPDSTETSASQEAKPLERNTQQSLGLVTFRLQAVTQALDTMMTRAKDLQTVFSESSSALTSAQAMVARCVDEVETLKSAQDDADVKDSVRENFRLLWNSLFGQGEGGGASAEGGDTGNNQRSVVLVLSEVVGRGTVAMSDCSWMLLSCNNITQHPSTELSFNKRISSTWENVKFTQLTAELRKVKEEMTQQAAKVVGETWGEMQKKLEEATEEYEDEFEAVSGVLRGAFELGRGLLEMVKGNAASRSRKELWRVRDRALFQLMAIRAAVRSPPPNSRRRGNEDGEAPASRPEEESEQEELEKLLKVVDQMIVRRRVMEQVPGIRKTLQSETFMQAMTDVVKEGVQDGEAKLKEEINERLQTVIELEDSLLAETDATKKQAGLIALHREKAALNKVMENVQDMCEHFKVLRSTLDQMTKQLEVINAKLDQLTDLVKDLQQDIRRLVGLPPLYVLDQYRDELKAKGLKMRNDVYIELTCTKKSDKKDRSNKKDKKKNPGHKEERDNTNKSDEKEPEERLLMDEAKEFLKSKEKGCMLISGRAGSGKSVFATKLEQYILGEYHDERAATDGKKVVLIWANLPALKNPLTGLFDEALQKYHFLPDQVRRLREEIQAENSEVEAVFVLDGYDELRPEYLWRNLYKTNNLESYRPNKEIVTEEGHATEEEKAFFAFPKVFVLCRQELLSTNHEGYKNSFLPLESLNVHKDNIEEAIDYFEEVEIDILKSDKFEEYAREYVALNVRNAFQKQFPHYNIKPQAKDWEDPAVLKHLVEVVRGEGTEVGGQGSHEAGQSSHEEDPISREAGQSPGDAGQSSHGAPISNEAGHGEDTELYYINEEYDWARESSFESDTDSEENRGLGLGDGGGSLQEQLGSVQVGDSRDRSEVGENGDQQVVADLVVADMRKCLKGHTKDNPDCQCQWPGGTYEENKECPVAKKWDLDELEKIGKLFDDDDDNNASENQKQMDERGEKVQKQLQALARSLAAPLQTPSSDLASKTRLAELHGELSQYLPKEASHPDKPFINRQSTIARQTSVTQLPSSPRQEPDSGAGVGGGKNKQVTGGPADRDLHEDFRMMFRFLLGVSTGKATTEKVEENEAKFVHELTHNRKLWTTEQIVHEYTQLPELQELTKTPFMIRIVVKILPVLKGLHATLSSVKEELILRLTEARADMAWAGLQQENITRSDGALAAFQRLLDLVDDMNREKKALPTDVGLQADRVLRFLSKQLDGILHKVVTKIVADTQDLVGDDSEAEMTPESIQQELTRALKRKPVRRFLIYHEFMKNFLLEKMQVRLASRAANIAPSQLRQEFWEYSQRLAVKMTGDALTKVTYHPRSVIFSDFAADEWHRFFGLGDTMRGHREEVMRVAPLKSQNNTYSFDHKSVQEFFVAMAMCDSVTQLVKESLIPSPAKFFDTIRGATAMSHIPASHHAMPRTPKISELADSNGALDMSADELALKDIQDALERKNMSSKAAERKRQAKAIHKLIQGLYECPLSTIDLSGEEAVRDFLLDTLLGNIQVASAFGAVASLCLTESLHKGKLRFVAENLRVLFTAPMPKREPPGSTLVHLVCHPNEANAILLDTVLRFCLDPDYSAKYGWDWKTVLTTKNKDGYAPLMVCLETKNWEMAELLLDHCSESMKEELIIDCETRKSELTSLDKALTLDGNGNFMFKSGEKMFVTEGKSYFQVEVNLCHLKILASDLNNGVRVGFGGSICVGFAAGTPPKPEILETHYKQIFGTKQNVQSQGTVQKPVKDDPLTKLDKMVTDLKAGPENKKQEQHTSATQPTNGTDPGKRSTAPPSTEGKKSTFVPHQHGKSDPEKAWKDSKHADWTRETNKRLSTCPVGGETTPGFHNVTGVALHVVEPFDSVMERIRHGETSQTRLELHAEKIVVPMPEEEEEEEISKTAIGNSRKSVPLFPKQAGVAGQGGGPGGTGKQGAPKLMRQESRVQQGADDGASAVLVLDKKKLKDKFACLGVAIDFQTDVHCVIVSCCWWTKTAPGEWQEIARVPKADGPFFPVVCTWGLLCRPEIDLGERQEGFRIGPPGGDEMGFKHYKKAVRGVPGHYRVARQEPPEWDIFFKLVEQVGVDQRFGLLSYLDPDHGMTLLHSFVNEVHQSSHSGGEKEVGAKKKVETLLDGAKACLGGTEQHAAGNSKWRVEDIMLAKDASGYSAFSLVADKDVAKSFMDRVADIGAKTQMMIDLLNRLYKETTGLPWLEGWYDYNIYFERVSVFTSTLESARKKTKGENDQDIFSDPHVASVYGTLVRQMRKVRENKSFFMCVMKGMLQEEEAKKEKAEIEKAEIEKAEDETPSSDPNAREEKAASIPDSDDATNGSQLVGIVALFVLPLMGHHAMELLNEDLKNEENVIKMAVRSDPRSLEKAPTKFRESHEFMDQAVQYDGLALQYIQIPVEQKEFEKVARCAVVQNPRALKYAGSLSGDESVVLAAVKENGMVLEHASEALRSNKKVVEAAVEQNCMALRFVDWEQLEDRQEIAFQAVRKDGMALQWVPKDMMREEPMLVQLAVQNSGQAIQYAPEEFKQEEEIVTMALKSDVGALPFVDDTYSENKDLILSLLEASPQVLQHLNSTMLEDVQIHTKALLKHPGAVLQVANSLDLDYEVEFMVEDLKVSSPQAHWSCVVFLLLTRYVDSGGFEDEEEADEEEADEEEADEEADEEEADGPERPYGNHKEGSDKTEQDEGHDGSSTAGSKAYLVKCAWLLRCLDPELSLDPSLLPLPPVKLPNDYAELITKAAQWRAEKEVAEEGALDMSACWVYLVRLTHLELSWQDEVSPDSDEMKPLRRALEQLVWASIRTGGSKDGELLEIASPEVRHQEDFVMEAVKRSGGAAFKYAPNFYNNFDIAKAAVELDPMNLEYVGKLEVAPQPAAGPSVDHREMYKELALGAVLKDAMSLEHVKRDHLTPEALTEIATAALESNGMALRHHPNKYLLDCLLALAHTWKAIEYVPEAIKRMPIVGNRGETRSFADFAVNRNGRALEYLLESAKEDKTVVLAAVMNDGTALQFASAKLREDREVCCEAVKSNGLALQFVDSEDFVGLSVISDNEAQAEVMQIITEAVVWHGSMLEYGPWHLCMEEDIVKDAIRSDILALQVSLIDLEPDFYKELLAHSLGNQRKYQFELARSLTQLAHSVDIDHGNRTIQFKNESVTVLCPRMVAVRGCRMYFEVKILELEEDEDEMWMQFGFADQTFNPTKECGEGVGDTEGSWALDAIRGLFFFEGEEKNAPSERVRVGTVLGFLCDPKKGTISFWANGRFISQKSSLDYRNAVEGVEFTGPGVFPALSGRNLKVEYNVGEPDRDGNPFKFTSNPLALDHNMREWFFKNRGEGFDSHNAAMDKEVRKMLADQARKGLGDQEDIGRPAGTLDLGLIDTSDPDKLLTFTTELDYKKEEFGQELEDKLREVVAEQVRVDMHKVSVNHRKPSGEGVEVGFSVTVPSKRADEAAFALTLANLNVKLKARGMKQAMAVTSETEKERRQRELLGEWPHVDEVAENEGSRYIENLQQPPAPVEERSLLPMRYRWRHVKLSHRELPEEALSAFKEAVEATISEYEPGVIEIDTPWPLAGVANFKMANAASGPSMAGSAPASDLRRFAPGPLSASPMRAGPPPPVPLSAPPVRAPPPETPAHATVPLKRAPSSAPLPRAPSSTGSSVDVVPLKRPASNTARVLAHDLTRAARHKSGVSGVSQLLSTPPAAHREAALPPTITASWSPPSLPPTITADPARSPDFAGSLRSSYGAEPRAMANLGSSLSAEPPRVNEGMTYSPQNVHGAATNSISERDVETARLRYELLRMTREVETLRSENSTLKSPTAATNLESPTAVTRRSWPAQPAAAANGNDEGGALSWFSASPSTTPAVVGAPQAQEPQAMAGLRSSFGVQPPMPTRGGTYSPQASMSPAVVRSSFGAEPPAPNRGVTYSPQAYSPQASTSPGMVRSSFGAEHRVTYSPQTSSMVGAPQEPQAMAGLRSSFGAQPPVSNRGVPYSPQASSALPTAQLAFSVSASPSTANVAPGGPPTPSRPLSQSSAGAGRTARSIV